MPRADEAMRWRLAMIDTARVSLDAQYFIWRNDAVGSLPLGLSHFQELMEEVDQLGVSLDWISQRIFDISTPGGTVTVWGQRGQDWTGP